MEVAGKLEPFNCVQIGTFRLGFPEFLSDFFYAGIAEFGLEKIVIISVVLRASLRLSVAKKPAAAGE